MRKPNEGGDMSKQHTPGPWKVSGSGRWVTARGVDGGHEPIAEAMHERDAALIAASPDLLAACEAMVKARASADDDGAWDALLTMREAIEKARGR